jgi:TolB protein
VLKAGRNFVTNGPMLFLTVNGHKPGDTIQMAAGNLALLVVDAAASSGRNISRLEIVWKGKVVKSVQASENAPALNAHVELDARESGWFGARTFERPREAPRFAHTSPIYVQVGQDPGIVPEDAQFFLDWIDREMQFYGKLAEFRSEADRQATLDYYRRARAVYERLAKEGLASQPLSMP